MNMPRVAALVFLCAALSAGAARNDFDGDGRSDQAVYHPPSGMWYFMMSTGGTVSRQFGFDITAPVTGDFDGDGLADIACYSPTDGWWYFQMTSEGFQARQFGFAGTIPVAGDFDGDGRSDIGCFDPSGGAWYVMASSDGFATFTLTLPNDPRPVVGDFDGDGRDDVGACDAYANECALLMTTRGATNTSFGPGTGFARSMVGDFDGDGLDDIGAYDHENTGATIYQSSAGTTNLHFFGVRNAEPVTGDYDGDGRDDAGFYFAPSGTWVLLRSTAGGITNQFGFEETIAIGERPYAATAPTFLPVYEVEGGWVMPDGSRLYFYEDGTCILVPIGGQPGPGYYLQKDAQVFAIVAYPSASNPTTMLLTLIPDQWWMAGYSIVGGSISQTVLLTGPP